MHKENSWSDIVKCAAVGKKVGEWPFICVCDKKPLEIDMGVVDASRPPS